MGRYLSGAEGARTPDLLSAIQALSQLSYGPFTYLTYYSSGGCAPPFGPSGFALGETFGERIAAPFTFRSFGASRTTETMANDD